MTISTTTFIHVHTDDVLVGRTNQGPTLTIGDGAVTATVFFKDRITAIRAIAALAEAVRLDIERTDNPRTLDDVIDAADASGLL